MVDEAPNAIPLGEQSQTDSNPTRLGEESIENKDISPTINDIHRALLNIQLEKKFRNLIINFFRKRGYLTYAKHSTTEHGLDILMVLSKENDPLGRGQFFLFQAKIKNITTSKWQNGLHAQIHDLLYRPIKYQAYNSNLVPKRIILITNGCIDEYVETSLDNMNQRILLPIETYDGLTFANILLANDYTVQDIEKDCDDEEYLGTKQ